MDCLVFFSLTATPDVYMNEVYDKCHVFSLLFNEESNFTSLLEGFRLDNYASINDQVLEPFANFADKEFGKYLYVIKDGLSLFVDVDADEEIVAQYTSEISRKLYGKKRTPVF